MDREVEWVEEVLATGLSDGADDVVVVVAATNEAVRAGTVVLSDGRVGSTVGSDILKLGTGTAVSSSIPSSM
jgi:hypothetical protein